MSICDYCLKTLNEGPRKDFGMNMHIECYLFDCLYLGNPQYSFMIKLFPKFMFMDETESVNRSNHKPIHVLSSINELLTIDENSLLISHLFLKNHWVDEITFNHNEMYGDENISESKKELLYIIGKLAMNYYDNIISPQEENFFSSTFMSNELKEEMKESFRLGDRTHEFNLRYINQNVDMNSLLYMLVGPRQYSDITLDHENYPHWFFEHLQTFNDYEDDVTEFCISIRKPSLVEWFNKQTVIKT